MAKSLLTRTLRKIGLKQGPSALAERVRAEGLTYLTDRKLVRMDGALREVAAAHVAGAYVEFGVALGGSAILTAEAAAARGAPFHGFDVFGRIPAPTSDKDDAKSKDRFKVIEAGEAEGLGGATYYGEVEDLYAQVCETLERFGHPVDGTRIVLHKGLFEDTVPAADLGQIAFAHVDCDWYDPVAYCLGAIAPRLAKGGVIVIDDYHDYGGCKTATDEFLAQNPDFVMDTGRNPILRRN